MLLELYKKYEHRFSLIAFFVGFVIDNLTLTRIDLWLDNIILGFYLFLAGFGIVLFHLLSKEAIRNSYLKSIAPFIPLFIQFAFGGLFSGYFVFYSRSASFVTSWFFVLLIALLLIGNEFFKKKYIQLEFQVSIFFITLFSFSIFYLPVVLKDIGVFIFLLSGVVSLITIALFILLLRNIVPSKVIRSQRLLIKSILGVYILFNFFYFTNIIPPIPLSMKDMGVYYDVERSGDVYVALTEDVPWYSPEQFFDKTLYLSQSSSVYVFSSVFAPTALHTKIFHSWQYYDEVSGRWVETDRFSYPIVGGRDGGYRGYTQKSSLFPGKWRVDVVTERNQVIGRITFTLQESQEQTLLKTERL